MSELDPRLLELARRMFEAATLGDTATLTSYIDRGVPVDMTEAEGNTLLMLAAYHGHAETVAALLARGADTDRVNDRDQTPVSGAIFKGEDEVVRLLLEAGADLDAGHPSARETAVIVERTDPLD
jgi:ankyrin repeat protein